MEWSLPQCFGADNHHLHMWKEGLLGIISLVKGLLSHNKLMAFCFFFFFFLLNLSLNCFILSAVLYIKNSSSSLMSSASSILTSTWCKQVIQRSSHLARMVLIFAFALTFCLYMIMIRGLYWIMLAEDNPLVYVGFDDTRNEAPAACSSWLLTHSPCESCAKEIILAL